MPYTQEEKQAYFQQIRSGWAQAKELASKDESIQKFLDDNHMKISPTSYFFVKEQMEAQGMDGIPYRDAKTFKGWKDEGKTVKKGEKSKLYGITWIGAKEGDEDEEGYFFPKVYRLFHKSQVEKVV